MFAEVMLMIESILQYLQSSEGVQSMDVPDTIAI